MSSGMKRTEVDDADTAAGQLFARVQKLKQAEARDAVAAAASASAAGGPARAATVDLRESPEPAVAVAPVVDLRDSPSPEPGDKKSAAIVID